MRRVLLVLVAALLAVPAAGADGDRLAAAFLQTASARSLQFSLQGRLTTQGQAVPVRASGALDTAARSARLSVDLANPGAAGLQRISFAAIVDGRSGALYLRFPLLNTLAGTKKPWLRLDLGKAASQQGLDLGPLLQADPGQQLALACALRGTHRVGAANVGGVATTHYRAVLDYRQAASCAPAALRGEVRSLGRGVNPASAVPLDAYVDGQGYVRRTVTDVSVRAGKQSLRAALTVDLSGFGQPVHVQPPPRSQVATPKNLSLDLGGLTPGD